MCWTCFFNLFLSFKDEGTSTPINKQHLLNENVQCHDQEESKLNSIIIVNNDAHKLIDKKLTKSSFI